MIAATRAHVRTPKRAQASWSNSRVAQQQCTLTEYELYSRHAKPYAMEKHINVIKSLSMVLSQF